jgi:hypothetical protein
MPKSQQDNVPVGNVTVRCTSCTTEIVVKTEIYMFGELNKMWYIFYTVIFLCI